MSSQDQILIALRKAIEGKRITEIGYMQKPDAIFQGWGYRPIVLVLEDGTTLFPMADDEGNEAGALATTVEGCETVGVLRT